MRATSSSPHGSWIARRRSVVLYIVLTVVLAVGFIGLDRVFTAGAAAPTQPQQVPPGAARLQHNYGAPPMPPCGSQLGFAGYSVTLINTSNAAETFATAAGLNNGDVVAEFQPLTNTAPALQNESAAQALGLDRMEAVNTSMFAGQTPQAITTHLRGMEGVAAAEPIWLQSSDKRYLACDYKLRDNATDQALAATARQALVAHDVSGSLLNDAGTIKYVSLRHFNGQALLQVAFVRRPVGAPSLVYVALLNPRTQTVLAVARANWYTWE